jgi:hypothetical protein
MLGKGGGVFQRPANYTAGNQPEAVVIGDFNGDGLLDLVVANKGDNTVSFFAGNGDGTFQAPVVSYAGIGPIGLAVGDFDKNGRLDLAVADSGGGVGLLTGNGDGTFGFQPIYTPAAGPPNAVAVADFDHDGNPDIAVAVPGKITGGVYVLLGNGDKTFSAVYAKSTSAGPTALAAGDFNGNGTPDLAVASVNKSAVLVFLNTLPSAAVSNVSSLATFLAGSSEQPTGKSTRALVSAPTPLHGRTAPILAPAAKMPKKRFIIDLDATHGEMT